jgi:hypothetical protein
VKWLLGICALGNIVVGFRDGASTELGFVHICFGVYIAADVIKAFSERS